MTKIINGDCLTVLQSMPSGSINCIVTSPPYYGLRNYGVDGQIGIEQSLNEYVAKLVDVFHEARRVLRDDGTLWLNLGDSYGKGKQLLGVPWRVAFALQADGWILRQDIIWNKPNPMPESVKDRCTKAHEYVFLLSKSQAYSFDACAMKERSKGRERFAGSATYSAGSGRNDAGERDMTPVKTRNKRSVWVAANGGSIKGHFAAFPQKLIEPCILAGCPIGGTVLDPFFGAGTTGLVAEKHGRNCIGIELNPEYIGLASARLAAVGIAVDA